MSRGFSRLLEISRITFFWNSLFRAVKKNFLYCIFDLEHHVQHPQNSENIKLTKNGGGGCKFHNWEGMCKKETWKTTRSLKFLPPCTIPFDRRSPTRATRDPLVFASLLCVGAVSNKCASNRCPHWGQSYGSADSIQSLQIKNKNIFYRNLLHKSTDWNSFCAHWTARTIFSC